MPTSHDLPARTPAQPDAGVLARFLESAPDDLKGWADEQLAQLGEQAEAAEDPDAVGLEAFADDFDDLSDEDPDDSKSGRPRVSGKSKASKAKANKDGKVGGVRKITLVLVTLLTAAVVIIVQQSGLGGSDSSSAMGGGTSSAMPSDLSSYDQVDEEQINQLKEQIEADPENADLKQQLAEVYLSSGLYQDAIDQLGGVLQLVPDDLDALLAIGVAEFNLNQDDQAEQHWTRATEVAPDQVESWYNLGFLYMAQDPPDYDKVEQAWGKVIEIDPDSELAATAQAHLEQIRAASPTASTGP